MNAVASGAQSGKQMLGVGIESAGTGCWSKMQDGIGKPGQMLQRTLAAQITSHELDAEESCEFCLPRPIAGFSRQCHDPIMARSAKLSSHAFADVAEPRNKNVLRFFHVCA